MMRSRYIVGRINIAKLALSAVDIAVVEDHYCDLDDIQNSFGGLDLVPGQRRTPLSRDMQVGSGRGSNCKQQ